MSYDIAAYSQPALGLQLPDGDCFKAPPAPPAAGPDALLFQRYADYLNAQREYMRRIDIAEARQADCNRSWPEDRGSDSYRAAYDASDLPTLFDAARAAEEAYGLCRRMFLSTPPLTDEGILLLLEFAVEEEPTDFVGVTDAATAIYSTILALKRRICLNAGRPAWEGSRSVA